MAIDKSVRCACLVLALAGVGCQSAPARQTTRAMPLLWERGQDEPPPQDTEPALPVDAPDRVTVMTFNMQHRDRVADLAALADYLRNAEGVPDFILCQEVLFEHSMLDPAASTASVLGDQLGYYTRGTQRHGNREGIAIISRYPFEYYDEIHLQARSSIFVPGFRRVSDIGEFKVPQVGLVRVVNTHLTNWPWERDLRQAQLRETLDWVAQRQREVPADLTILGGDLNATRERPELGQLADLRWAGAATLCDGNTDEPTYGAPHAFRRIDYIFAAAPAGGVNLLDERVLFADGLWRRDGSERFWISDHLPVLHEYALSPRTAALDP